MTQRYILDANILIRFLTGNPSGQAAAAQQLLKQAMDGKIELELTELCLAEVVWVLQSFYRCPRTQIIKHLQSFLITPGIVIPRRKLVEEMVRRFATTNVDIADAFHAALAAEKKLPIASFDEDFDKFKDIIRFEPTAS